MTLCVPLAVEPSHWAIEAKGPRAPHQKGEVALGVVRVHSTVASCATTTCCRPCVCLE